MGVLGKFTGPLFGTLTPLVGDALQSGGNRLNFVCLGHLVIVNQEAPPLNALQQLLCSNKPT
jgi:hypothetical protein